MPGIPLTSCEEGQPLIKLEEGGEPSRLNYNLPASTAIRTKGYIPLGCPISHFKEEFRKAPPEKKNPWPAPDPDPDPGPRRPSVGGFVLRPDEQVDLIPDPVGPVEHGGIVWTPQLDRAATIQGGGFGALKAITQKAAMVTMLAKTSEGGAPQESQAVTHTLEYSIPQTTLAEIDRNVAKGRLPLFSSTLWGAPTTTFVAEPSTEEVTPRLFIIEHYVTVSYLRDYGAGRTINTFSLLPGEKSTISIRSFRRSSTSASKTDNVLDSYSKASADEFEQMLQSEVDKHESSSDRSSMMVSSTDTDTYGGGGSIGLNLAVIEAGGEASASSTSTESSERTAHSVRESVVDSSRKALDRHVAQSSAARTVEVKSDSQASSASSEAGETATVRTLENVNQSRVLNFVFRQLAQQYVTVTYLADVQIGFANGYPNCTRIERLDNINGLLGDVLEKEHVDEVRKDILREANSVIDKDGNLVEFLERVEDEMVDPETGKRSKRRIRWRKRCDLGQKVEDIDVEVPGVVLDVSERILPTDAVIVEALLGQAEALDCYNERLQDAATTRAQLENEERAQAIEIIGAIPDPVAQAEAYKNVFGECCPTPQTAAKNGDGP